MNDFDTFDKWALIILIAVFIAVIIGLSIYAYSLNEFVEAVRELK